MSAGLVAVVLVMVTVSLVGAWASPGNDSYGVKWVEWVRGHGGGSLVSFVENVWYSHHLPPKGGRPPPGLIRAAAPAPTTTIPSVPHLDPPTPVPLIVTPPLLGEGQWHPVGAPVGGIPAVYVADLRPDPVYTSLVTAVAWMDTKLLAAKLFAGVAEPGGQWADMAPLPPADQGPLIAAFNSGFRMKDSNGGFYLDGKTAGTLLAGSASFVIHSDGTATVGQWARDVSMAPDVVAVRQNLQLIVDGGAAVPGLADGSTCRWGCTLGNKDHVWRSGVGVTAEGALVYAAGPGLNITDLANVLAHAGAIRAMELDINTDWVNFFSFDPAPGQPAQPANGTKLLPAMVRDPSRYFTDSSRDFITMEARLGQAAPAPVPVPVPQPTRRPKR